jgi:hypothetical protein
MPYGTGGQSPYAIKLRLPRVKVRQSKAATPHEARRSNFSRSMRINAAACSRVGQSISNASLSNVTSASRTASTTTRRSTPTGDLPSNTCVTTGQILNGWTVKRSTSRASLVLEGRRRGGALSACPGRPVDDGSGLSPRVATFEIDRHAAGVAAGRRGGTWTSTWSLIARSAEGG